MNFIYLDNINVILRRHQRENSKPVKNLWSIENQGRDDHRNKIGNQDSKVELLLVRII